MNKIKTILVTLSLIIISFWSLNYFFKKNEIPDISKHETQDESFYWTCPMHPQIHLDHEGECPICHMKLVKVLQKVKTSATKTNQDDKRSVVQATPDQLDLIGIQKVSVEKMTLNIKIPISGRITSSSSVAFQVYEKDLRYVRKGLFFRGEPNVYSESDISGFITSIDTTIDPTSRTVRVVGLLQKGKHEHLAETSFSGEIQIKLKDHLAIPESSVLHTGNGDLIYLVDDQNKLRPKKVKLGIKTEGFYEVLGGLDVGDFISSGPNFLIDSEAKIRGAND